MIWPDTAEPRTTRLRPNRRRGPLRTPPRSGVKVALFDIDGTLTRHKSIWQFLMEETGVWDGPGRANLDAFLAGRIDYQEFCDLDAELFRGRAYAEVEKIAHEVPKWDGLDALFAALKARGYRVVLISTGLRLMASYFTRRYDIADVFANDLERSDGICTGRSLIDVGEHEKEKVVRDVLDRLAPDHVLALGDSSGDLPLFRAADLAVAVNPDERVAGAVHASLIGEDLAVLADVL
ncbi:HAD family phosphatase [Streptomyces sp. NPDC041068]|uniref:HAD family hydrolase n=1 Tax=Streptomyces sp. NPDC041068 TaxID=3155130 RepID=UPI0033FB752E